MARKLALATLLACLVTLTACENLSDFTTAGPPPGDYDRPAIVRGFARAGTYVGAAVGVVAAVVFYLPGKALTLIADEPLGYTAREWPYVPLTASATVGHYALGLPAEAVHFLVWGAWVERPAAPGFEDVAGGGEASDGPSRR